ncbi:MAG TPA: hypothetical protein VF163_13650 [Micromonosporaceae bacterium]
MAISTALYWAIVLFNVPKILVPPGRRAEPGALAERRHKKAVAATLTPGDPGSAE